jgi:hypothetical protein
MRSSLSVEVLVSKRKPIPSACFTEITTMVSFFPNFVFCLESGGVSDGDYSTWAKITQLILVK